jgi:hypothetical protein
LFPGELTEDGFLAAGIPVAWEPGTSLELRGPLGHGFELPAAARRLALGAIDGSLDRLMPLIRLGLEREMAVTLYIDHGPIILGDFASYLSSAVEIHPLASLPEALSWADLLALDLERQDIHRLRLLLGGDGEGRLPCPAQALIRTPLTCGGIADCGVCAVPGRRRWKPVCTDGPVFALNELDW